jgi:hypothetical protein
MSGYVVRVSGRGRGRARKPRREFDAYAVGR